MRETGLYVNVKSDLSSFDVDTADGFDPEEDGQPAPPLESKPEQEAAPQPSV